MKKQKPRVLNETDSIAVTKAIRKYTKVKGIVIISHHKKTRSLDQVIYPIRIRSNDSIDLNKISNALKHAGYSSKIVVNNARTHKRIQQRHLYSSTIVAYVNAPNPPDGVPEYPEKPTPEVPNEEEGTVI